MIENEYGKFTDNELTGETAEQVFERWLKNKDKIVQEPTLEEKNRADIDYILLMQGL